MSLAGGKQTYLQHLQLRIIALQELGILRGR
jgi:hypothetical protein